MDKNRNSVGLLGGNNRLGRIRTGTQAAGHRFAVKADTVNNDVA